MININEIQEGDTVILRNGIKEKVVRMGGDLTIGGFTIQYWRENGSRNFDNSPSSFDIIAIEKKPRPRKLVQYIDVNFDKGFAVHSKTLESIAELKHQLWKVTYTEGQEPTIEAVETTNA